MEIKFPKQGVVFVIVIKIVFSLFQTVYYFFSWKIYADMRSR